MDETWERRDGSVAVACMKERQPLPPAEFSPIVMHPIDDDDARVLRTMRNVRRRDRARGVSPTRWE
jgi:hypothetical protein